MITVDDLPTVNDTLLLIRDSIEAGERYVHRGRDAARSLYLDFETTRFPFGAFYARRLRAQPGYEDSVVAIQELASGIRSLLARDDFRDNLNDMPTIRRVKRPRKEFSYDLAPLLEIRPKTITLLEFVEKFLSILDDGVVFRDAQRVLFD